jgi:predicted HTH transcriptional regulator
VAAFLNSQGGIIYIGVGDNGEIVGIELDGFSNTDKWALHLVNRIGQQIGIRFLTLCLIEFDDLHGKSVARITVHPSPEPAYLDECIFKAKGEKMAFFVRGGPSAQKLPPKEVPAYLSRRFPPLATLRQPTPIEGPNDFPTESCFDTQAKGFKQP